MRAGFLFANFALIMLACITLVWSVSEVFSSNKYIQYFLGVLLSSLIWIRAGFIGIKIIQSYPIFLNVLYVLSMLLIQSLNNVLSNIRIEFSHLKLLMDLVICLQGGT